jgi:hypothetical protein
VDVKRLQAQVMTAKDPLLVPDNAAVGAVFYASKTRL